MKKLFALVVVATLLIAAKSPDEIAVRTFLESVAAGDGLSSETVPFDPANRELPQFDEYIGCKVTALDPLLTGNFGVQWKCKGRSRREQPSPMIIYVTNGKITKVTTASVRRETTTTDSAR